jgi:hypothetical protein
MEPQHPLLPQEPDNSVTVPLIGGVLGVTLLLGIAYVALTGDSLTVEKAIVPAAGALRAAVQDQNIDVTMSVAVISENPLTITGSSNLPDGTILSILLIGDRPACLPRCGFELAQATVKDGRFLSKIEANAPLISDSYTIDIVTPMAAAQPANVQSVIGSNGERLRGSYVAALDASSNQYISVDPSVTPPSQYLGGLSIHYKQRINVR